MTTYLTEVGNSKDGFTEAQVNKLKDSHANSLLTIPFTEYRRIMWGRYVENGNLYQLYPGCYL